MSTVKGKKALDLSEEVFFICGRQLRRQTKDNSRKENQLRRYGGES